MMVIHITKTFGHLVAIVCARVLGHDGRRERFGAEESGMNLDLHSLQKYRHGHGGWATVIDEYYSVLGEI